MCQSPYPIMRETSRCSRRWGPPLSSALAFWVFGKPLKRELTPRRAGDPPALVAGNEVMRQTLDWRPANDDIDTLVAHALAWERRLIEQASAPA